MLHHNLHGLSVLNICLFGTGVYFIKRLLDSQRSNRLPPGPTGWPLVGSLFQISAEKNWEDFAALGKKYGDISSIRILGTRYVVLNSTRAITEILEKQSIKCSDRPRLVMADLVGFNNSMAFIHNGDRLRQYRKHFSHLFGSRSSTGIFNPIEEEETRQFLRNVLQKPDDLAHHIRSNAATIILKVAYGYTVQEGTDPIIELTDRVMRLICLLLEPGAFLVDSVPALRYLPEWFPGTRFLQDAKKYNQFLLESIQTPHQWVKDQMAAGTAIPSFTSKLLEEEVTQEEEDIIKWASSQVFVGGADTVVSTIYAFFLAMVLNPEVQAKAQAELDSVVGNERLPCFEDRDSLPYINAICKEVLRWHTVGPVEKAIPHIASEDIYCDGYLIPKGTYIIGNSWAVLHDAATYPDPNAFRPERYLGETPQPDPQIVCFGFGRRICAGYNLAEAALFISVAMSLAVLKISKAVVNGVVITPEYDLLPGAITHPKPFKCQITARSAQAEALLDG